MKKGVAPNLVAAALLAVGAALAMPPLWAAAKVTQVRMSIDEDPITIDRKSTRLNSSH